MNTNKVQPQAAEIEDIIIGSIIYESEAFDLVSGMLKQEHFYKSSNALIYKACYNLATNNKPIDLIEFHNNLLTQSNR